MAATASACLHHAVDDHSRPGYAEFLGEAKETAAFWLRAAHGINVKAVLADRGSCYRSRVFAAAPGPHIKHRRTTPAAFDTSVGIALGLFARISHALRRIFRLKLADLHSKNAHFLSEDPDFIL